MIYFDHNATSPLSETGRQAWLAATERYTGNPSSPHRLGNRAEVALANAKQQLAGLLRCSELDLIWTSGATEANNAVFYHASRSSAAPVWISSIEHPSVIASAHRWFPGKVELLRATAHGTLDLDSLSDQLKQARPALVALMAANNETGVLQPWREALRLCRERDVPFFCDAAQWVGKLGSENLGECDFISGCGHKFGGPLGVGFLKVPPGFTPLIVGGPQEDRRRAGTENVPAILSFAAALDDRERLLQSNATQARTEWRDEFVQQVCYRLPGVEVLGAKSQRLWNTVSAAMPASNDCRRRWVVQLDKLGFAVSTGSACASGKAKPSHVLTAMGFDPEKSDRMLRFSSGWDTTAADWQKLLFAIEEANTELQRNH